MSAFDPARLLDAELLKGITERRVMDPDLPRRVQKERQRRTGLSSDGRLVVIAADHPARGVTAAAGDDLIMANRGDYLARIVRALLAPGVDGVMATVDVLEELLILHALLLERGAPALLDDKLLIASMNRGGLSGSAWELDDPMTGPTARTIATQLFDGAKMLLRIDPMDPASLRTIEACAKAITELDDKFLPAFLEPLPTRREGGAAKVTKDAAALARIAGIASALGSSTRQLWLKLPWCPDYGTVARSTTLPILLLGGETGGPPLLDQVADGLSSGSNVRGVMVGRNVLYAADPQTMTEAVVGLVRQGKDLAWARARANEARPQGWAQGRDREEGT